MPKFVKKSGVVEANQWFRMGNDPAVKPYKTSYRNNSVCPDCNNRMNLHGWVDGLAGGIMVCPGDFVVTCSEGKYWPYKPETFFDMFYTHKEYAAILLSKH